MTDFPDKLRLKEQAEEDIYFAKRDKERIEALHKKRQAGRSEEQGAGQQDRCGKPRRTTENR